MAKSKRINREDWSSQLAREEAEQERFIRERTVELLQGERSPVPFDLTDLESDPLMQAVGQAANVAFVQGWIASEIDFLDKLWMLSMMGEDHVAYSELWEFGQKMPETDYAMDYRRDWFLYEYARDKLKLAGFNPYGPRPKEIPPLASRKDKKGKTQKAQPKKDTVKKVEAKKPKAKKLKAKKAIAKKANAKKVI